MPSKHYIRYTDGWKYQLKFDYSCKTGIEGYAIDTEYLKLTTDGKITIKEGYAWDGPSGPAIDSKDFMRGSLVHDALYQLIRDGHIKESCRDDADRLLRRQCEEDGMWSVRAWWVYAAVRKFGKAAVGKDGRHPIIYAPYKPKREELETINE
jgi:hypothetical protein